MIRLNPYTSGRRIGISSTEKPKRIPLKELQAAAKTGRIQEEDIVERKQELEC
jgi:hypothetical protein